jgi:methylated-DNA-[protein]-cysteine S-methyltransferase
MAVPNAHTQRWLVERVDHPLLPLLVANDEEGGLRAVQLHARESSLLELAQRSGAELEWRLGDKSSDSVRQLEGYLQGNRRTFELRLDPHGTPFEKEVWERVAQIEWGETRSYGQLADELGRPGAARAVGRANGANPIPLVVPCHRVIGQRGELTGFAGGVETKAWLLERESAQTGLFSSDVGAPRDA